MLTFALTAAGPALLERVTTLHRMTLGREPSERNTGWSGSGPAAG